MRRHGVARAEPTPPGAWNGDVPPVTPADRSRARRLHVKDRSSRTPISGCPSAETCHPSRPSVLVIAAFVDVVGVDVYGDIVDVNVRVGVIVARVVVIALGSGVVIADTSEL
eukprot:966180-Rhodomonas_salina.1